MMDAAQTIAQPATSTPAEPHVVKRLDYRPPDWLVPEIRFDFLLGIEATKVTATIVVEKNPAGSGSGTIVLDGDSLALDSLAVDGQLHNDYRIEDENLVIDLAGDRHELVIETTVDPKANTQLSGLYASSDLLCTQCEAEGFRRITFFPDRPDVLARYKVRLNGDKAAFPVLLSNGNLVAEGDNGDGTHWAEWDDPWPKPSYLFALVAGQLVATRDTFTTRSGREVKLAVWVRPGDETRTEHAMVSLKHSMKWDEDVYGREYDLDEFNIVAVSDFNAGAMENKGLNIFNTRYVLADPETATDSDYDGIEAVVAHEYFHNWSGNRVTCRDWFQLSLKEGFTVLRDQQFSADMGSEPVNRIDEARSLRSVQFPEDSGPLAHPIRPDSYQDISNFYTSTVYDKGAEVIRMMTVLAGKDRFRKGTDLYFERHDGEAATCEDFVKAIEDGAGLDLKQFRRWYEQAGTPRVSVDMTHDAASGTVTLTLGQTVPATPGQPDKQPMVIPLRTALFDRATGSHAPEQLLVLTEPSQSWTFDGFAAEPVLSINRGFSAPVIITTPQSRDDLVFLAQHDDDPFARYEAVQQLVVQYLTGTVTGSLSDADGSALAEGIVRTFAAVIADAALDDQMRAMLLSLPTDTYILEQIAPADPTAIRAAREGLKARIATELASQWQALHDRCSAVPYSLEASARGARALKTLSLVILAAGDKPATARRAKAQYDAADNMTDRQGALGVLTGFDSPEREAALEDFHARFAGNALVIDKWFMLQAGSLHPNVIEQVKALAARDDFALTNPNRLYALYMAFTANLAAFHKADGEGYRMIADLIIALNPINSNTAARFVPALGRWKKIEPARAALMRAELERIAATPGLSSDVTEQVTKSLA